MGLDQYARIDRRTPEIDDEEDFYWRKHNRLEGWMARRWRKKNGLPDTAVFAGDILELDSQDIADLEKDVRSRLLPKTDGFFFGSDSYDDPWKDAAMYEYDLTFLKAAKKGLAESKRVFYWSSW